MFQRAKVFKSLGYLTSIFKDSDKTNEHAAFTTEAQGLGISIFEWGNNFATEDALFSCCPQSAIPELIEDGRTGLLVPPNQPDRMAQAMIRLLTEKGLREKIISEARERVVRKFNNKVLIKDLALLYREAGVSAPEL